MFMTETRETLAGRVKAVNLLIVVHRSFGRTPGITTRASSFLKLSHRCRVSMFARPDHHRRRAFHAHSSVTFALVSLAKGIGHEFRRYSDKRTDVNRGDRSLGNERINGARLIPNIFAMSGGRVKTAGMSRLV
jgi:hypothetical protein